MSLTQQLWSYLGRLVVHVSRYLTHTHTETHTHTHTVALLCVSDQPVAEAATCATHNKHNRRTFIFSAEFEPTIPAIKRTQNYALDCTAARMGETHFYLLFFRWRLYGPWNRTAVCACSLVHVFVRKLVWQLCQRKMLEARDCWLTDIGIHEHDGCTSLWSLERH